MTLDAPAAKALATSPEVRRPPSAITGTPSFDAASTLSRIAVSCGTPTPATMRVVQIEPGPMPTLTPSAPASINALVASPVDRKSVVEGKSVSVRVDIGGRRSIKKKKKYRYTRTQD